MSHFSWVISCLIPPDVSTTETKLVIPALRHNFFNILFVLWLDCTAGGTAIATVYVCDMEKGIISAGIEEEFKLPTGVTKKISCKKTIVADQPMEDN